MQLTLFDLDNTLLAGDSDYLWGRFLVDEGVVDASEYARENDRFHAQYQAGNLDIQAFQRFALQPLIDNPPARMQALRREFIEEIITPLVTPAALALVNRHRQAGDRLVIITATNRFVTEPIAQLLGIDRLLATEPEMVDGRFTGKIAGVPCYREGKIKRLEQWLASQPERFEASRFYSDSHNDLPLLERVDHPVAVDPDDVLRAAARRRGWPIINLNQ